MTLFRTMFTAFPLHVVLVSASAADVTGLLGGFNSPPMPGTPAFRLMRADDPWPANQPNQWFASNTNGFPELLPLHWGEPDRLALELGGEARWRWERFDNDVWGAIPDDENGAWLSRYMLHGDLRLGPHVRAFGQLKSHFVGDKQAPIRAVDDNRLDVHQAFGQINVLLGWTISRNLYLELNYAHFFAGEFLADTGPSEDVDYAAVTMVFRF